MEQKKITAEEIEKNMEKLKETYSIARLDNHAKLSPKFIKDMEERAKGTLSMEEVTKRIKEGYYRE